jgi:hypothetical protein
MYFCFFSKSDVFLLKFYKMTIKNIWIFAFATVLLNVPSILMSQEKEMSNSVTTSTTDDASESKILKMEKIEVIEMAGDSVSEKENCCASCYTSIVGFSTRYYTDAMNNTRTTLASNGLFLEQQALEYQLRLYNLPKIFFYNQIGNLNASRYVSVTGIGLKESLSYNFFKNSGFILAPYGELGVGYFNLHVTEGIGNNSISSALNGNLESISLDNFTVTADAGLSLGGRFVVGNARFSIMAHGGYIVNYPTQWRIASSLAFREKINIGSPYLGATIKLDLSCNGNNCCSGSTCCK